MGCGASGGGAPPAQERSQVSQKATQPTGAAIGSTGESNDLEGAESVVRRELARDAGGFGKEERPAEDPLLSNAPIGSTGESQDLEGANSVVGRGLARDAGGSSASSSSAGAKSGAKATAKARGKAKAEAETAAAGMVALSDGVKDLWHGTSIGRLKDYCSGEIVPSWNGLFGPGFYLTSKRSKAIAWAQHRAFQQGEEPIILQFRVVLGKCKTYDVKACSRFKYFPSKDDGHWGAETHDRYHEGQGPWNSEGHEVNKVLDEFGREAAFPKIAWCPCADWLLEGFDSQYVPMQWDCADDDPHGLSNGDEYVLHPWQAFKASVMLLSHEVLECDFATHDVREDEAPPVESLENVRDRSSLIEYTKYADILWLRREYVLRLRDDSKCFPRKQDTPPEAFYTPSQVGEFLKRGGRPLVVSYPWEAPHHPDPTGRHINDLCTYIETQQCRETGDPMYADRVSFRGGLGFEEYGVCVLPIFVDFPCLPQLVKRPDGKILHGRTKEDQIRFDRALANMHLFYMHDLTHVLCLDLPVPETATNPRAYQERGWCEFERRASLLKASTLDKYETTKSISFKLWLAKPVQCEREKGDYDTESESEIDPSQRLIPMIPNDFCEMLERRTFTNGHSDRATVGNLYRKAWDLTMGSRESLDVAELTTVQLRDFAKVLTVLPKLERLDMGDTFNSESIKVFSQGLMMPGACSHVQTFVIRGVHLAEGDAIMPLVSALKAGALPNLKQFMINWPTTHSRLYDVLFGSHEGYHQFLQYAPPFRPEITISYH